MPTSQYKDNVFINCPFDKKYKRVFDAIVFTIFACEFVAHCTLEVRDASQVRINKIYKLIRCCKYGIHDICRTELDGKTNLPRFNMPFELGLFLSAKEYGQNEQREKMCLILDKEQHRYKQFISDISGQDIEAYENSSRKAILKVRDWLCTVSQKKGIPSGSVIWEDYKLFKSELPSMCARVKLRKSELIFNDYILLVQEWLKIQTKR